MTGKQVVEYDVTAAAISEMRNLYMDLNVADVEDQKGFEEVELARKYVKGKRVAVEKQRKVFKSDALEYGRMVDSKAKEIFALLEPIESHLAKEGDKIRDEEKRIKDEAAAIEKAKIQERVDALMKVGIVLDFFTVATMSDEDYNSFYTTSRTNFDAEQTRIAAEEKAKVEQEVAERAERERQAAINKAESERLEKIRIEQEAKEAELKAAQDKIDADKKAAQAAKNREALEKRLEEEATAKAEKERQDEIAWQAEQERMVKDEAERVAALKPDKERLIAWANELLEITTPELKSVEANNLAGQTQAYIYRVAKDLIQTAGRL